MPCKHIGSDPQGQGHNQRSEVKSFLLSYEKTTVANVFELHEKEAILR